eukprot:SAG22_NODE_71_length_22540_cov_8.918052_3_plen_257_part_00
MHIDTRCMAGKMSTFVDLVHVCTEFWALDVKLLETLLQNIDEHWRGGRRLRQSRADLTTGTSCPTLAQIEPNHRRPRFAATRGAKRGSQVDCYAASGRGECAEGSVCLCSEALRCRGYACASGPYGVIRLPSWRTPVHHVSGLLISGISDLSGHFCFGPLFCRWRRCRSAGPARACGARDARRRPGAPPAAPERGRRGAQSCTPAPADLGEPWAAAGPGQAAQVQQAGSARGLRGGGGGGGGGGPGPGPRRKFSIL